MVCATATWRGRRGFSMAELLIVLLIVGLLAVLVVPQLEIVKYRMDGAARGYVTAMIAAQRVAVKRQHNVVVAFDTVNRRLRLHYDTDNDGTIDSGESTRHVPLAERVQFGLGTAPPRTFGSSSVSFTQTQDGMPVVRFIRNGSASEFGGFYLTSERATRMTQYARDVRAIEIDRATGRASWYYYNPPTWKQGF